MFAASFGASGIRRRIAGRAKKPTGKDCAAWQGRRLLGEDDKHGLGDVLGKLPIPRLARGDRIDHVDMALDQRAESQLGVMANVVAQ
jgi:hypothetical protein